MDPASGVLCLIPQDGTDVQVVAQKGGSGGSAPTVTDVCARFDNALMLKQPQDTLPQFIGTSCEHIQKQVEDLYDGGDLIEGINFGSSFGFAELASGDIVGFGSNEFGQLGTGGLGITTHPRVVDRLKNASATRSGTEVTAPIPVFMGGNRRPLEVVQIVCGFDHTIVLTADGCVYTSGSGLRGQLGTGVQAQTSFACVKSLIGMDESSSRKCVKVAAGHGFSAAVTDNGALLMWGSGSQYQLGTGKPKREQRPVCVPLYGEHSSEENGEFVHEVSCGFGHVGAVAGVNRRLYTWGQSIHGQTGHANCSVQKTPRLVEELRHLSITSVKCSRASTCILTDDGRVYIMGSPYLSPTLVSLKGLTANIGNNVDIPKFASEPIVTSIESCDGFSLAFVPTQLQACDMRAVASTGSRVVFRGAGIQYSESVAPVVRFSLENAKARTACGALRSDGSISCFTPDFSSLSSSFPLVVSVSASLDDGRSFSLPIDIAVFRNSPTFPSAPRPRLASILGGDSIELPVDPTSIDCAIVFTCLRVRLAKATQAGTASTETDTPLEVDAEFLPSKSVIRFVLTSSLQQMLRTRNDETNSGRSAELDIHVALDGQNYIKTSQSLFTFDVQGLFLTPKSLPLIGGPIEIRCAGLDVPFEKHDIRVAFCHENGTRHNVAASARKAERVVVPKSQTVIDKASLDKTKNSADTPPNLGDTSGHDHCSETAQESGDGKENEEETTNEANKAEENTATSESDEEAEVAEAEVAEAECSDELEPDSSCAAGSASEEHQEECSTEDAATLTEDTEHEGVFVVSCETPSLIPLAARKCAGHAEMWALEISLNGTRYVPLDLSVSYAAPMVTTLQLPCVLRTTTPGGSARQSARSNAAASVGDSDGLIPLTLNILGDHLFPDLKPSIEFWTTVQKKTPNETEKEEGVEASVNDEAETTSNTGDAKQAESVDTNVSEGNESARGGTSSEPVQEVVAAMPGRVLPNGKAVECDLGCPPFIDNSATESLDTRSARSSASGIAGNSATKLNFCNVRVRFDGVDVDPVEFDEKIRIYDQPVVTKVSPLNGPVGESTALSLIGTGFFESEAITVRFTYATDGIAFSKTVPATLVPLVDEADDVLETERTLTCSTPSFAITWQADANKEQDGGESTGGDDANTSGEPKALESGSKLSLELAMNGKQFVQIPKFQFTLK